jgi:predicted PurR-regulated permease PerM
MERRYFEITWASLWRVLVFVLALIILYLIRDILILFIVAIIISAVCQPPVDYLQKKKVARFLGTSLVFVLILAIFGVLLWLVIPLVISQFGHFITNFNETISKLEGNNFLTDLIQQFIVNLKVAFDAVAKGATTIFSLVFSIFGGIFLAITCLVLAFYLTVEEKGVEKFFKIMLPKSYEDLIIVVFERSVVRIGRWFQARIVLSVIEGLLTWLGLYLLGIKFSGTLALLSGVLSNVPLVGAIFAGSIAALVALTDSWLLALWVIIFFIILNQLENALLTPLVMKKIAGLPPLAVLLALLIGTKIAGLLGFILAIPLAIIFQEVYDESVRRRKRI